MKLLGAFALVSLAVAAAANDGYSVLTGGAWNFGKSKDIRLIHWLVCPIHDAILMDIPEDEVDYVRAAVAECMTQTINGIEFPVSSGPAGDTWEAARH